jgi:hypothetical protein
MAASVELGLARRCEVSMFSETFRKSRRWVPLTFKAPANYITLVLPHTKAFATVSHNFNLELKRYNQHYGRLQLQVPNRGTPLRR